MFFKSFRSLILAALIASTPLCYADHTLLQPKDVSKIMQQIFDQHGDDKEMSDSILKKSFKIYIDQFDPHRIYLTAQESQPFLQLSSAQISRIMQQYKDNRFPEYQDLNDIIQKAILRARTIRDQVANDPSLLFRNSSSVTADGYGDWSDPDLKQPFAENETQLKERIQNYMTHYIANERKRFGDNVILNHEVQTIKIIDRQLRAHENQYLFTLENGQPMGEAEKQNALAMHILKSLASSLDAHTTVLNPMEAYDMRIKLENEVDGIGVILQQNSKGDFIISQLLEGGPAAKSGLVQAGDRILEIDGQALTNLPSNQVIDLMRGKNGSKISVVISRVENENGQKIDKKINLQLVREAMQVNADRVQSTYEKYGNGIIGIIKLDAFYQGDNGVTSEKDVRNAILKLEKQGNLRALVLDLRENSGGFLSQAVKVAGLFITNGIVVISKYFNGDEHFYRDMDGKMAYDGPLIILTSKATASAAEIVAQALQDYGVAIVVGDEHTYGKGTIQSQTVTENQSSTYFKVTVGKYYTVSGKTPQIQGVKADVVVPSQFAHENIGEEYLDYALKQDTISPEYDDKLSDVPASMKSWYLHYYVPTIQHKKDQWRGMLSTLRQNSGYRIAHNKQYQLFLKGTLGDQAKSRPGAASTNDLQLGEAVNIAKDMVALQEKQRRGDVGQETAVVPSSSQKSAEFSGAPTK